MLLKSVFSVRFAAAVFVLGVAASVSQATEVRVTVENLQPESGFFFTPVWMGFHDGGFDLFDQGVAASDALETIAETGDPGPLGTLLTAEMNSDGSARAHAAVLAPDGFAGAPVFDPGEVVTQVIDVSDPMANRYLTYASMIIPSNDAFFGNSNPMAYEVFAADGSLNGPLTIEVFGSNVYDSGTEMNNAMGAAFSALGGTDSEEGSVVELHPGLDNFVGTDTVAGTTIAAALGSGDPIARITVQAVPEPSSLTLGLLGMLGILRCRRRR